MTNRIHITLPGGGWLLLEYDWKPILKGELPPKPEGTSTREFYARIADLLVTTAYERGFPRIRYRVDGDGVQFLFPFRGGIGPQGIDLDWFDPLDEVMTAPEVAKTLNIDVAYVRLGLGKRFRAEGMARQTEGGTWLYRKDAVLSYTPSRNKPRGRK